jgi:hypothetical protein
MRVPEDLPDLQRPWLQQLGGNQSVGVTGDGTRRGHGEPEAPAADRPRPLPTVPPAVLPGLTPGSCSVNRGLRDFPGQPMLLVPAAAVGAPGRPGDGGRVSWGGPGLQQHAQMAPQTAKPRGQPRGQLLKTPFPGTPGGKTAVRRQHRTPLGCHGVVLVQKAAQGLGRRASPHHHDEQGFDQELVGITLLPPTLAFDWWRGRGALLDEPEYAAKDAAVGEPCSASGV